MKTQHQKDKTDLGIVVPVKNEESSISPFLRELTKHCDELNINYQVLFVNDGSTDSTLERLVQAQAEYPNIKIVNLARNFGKEIALTAGLEHINAHAIVPIDVDLQDPPEVIKDLYQEYLKGFDVVVAKRQIRTGDAPSKVLMARVFHWMFKKMSDTSIPHDAGDFRIMSERVVDVIRNMPERNRFMKGILSWPGFSTSSISYARPTRVAGDSKWNFSKLWNLALDGIFSFSTLPLRIWTYLGLALASTAILYMIFTVLKTLIFGIDLPGYASLLTFILLIGGVNLIGIGVLGEYIGRIFIEVKGRPLYVVESVLEAPATQHELAKEAAKKEHK